MELETEGNRARQRLCGCWLTLTDHITKITAVAPGGECPQWQTFLAQITNDNRYLQDVLQRVAGYSLTGSIQEHALFFSYCTGGNGKSVFLNTLTGIMGDYASVASMETFTASASDRHSTDLALARGARLVTAQETEEGRRWAEARIKSNDERRPNQRAVHAAGLFHVPARFQTVHRRQP